MSQDFEFPPSIVHKLGEKKEPNLWNPPSTDSENRPVLNKANVQSLISAIFYKVGRDSFDLGQHEFEVHFDRNLNVSYDMIGGPKVLVLWKLVPRWDKEFDSTMRRCLAEVKAMRHPVAIEKLARLQARQAEVPSTKHLVGVPIQDVAVETYMLVKVIHRRTGLVSIQYCRQEKGKTWRALIAQARYEIKKGLDFTLGSHNEQDSKAS